ncbi:MAG: trigger factor [Candidatus Dormibacteraeota bacterium]|nr:trigger factor [Candidatus Dormibacteraeota bacterium]
MAATEVSITTEDLPGSQVGLTIEVPSERVDRAYERVLQRLSQKVRIEGFRPGKAPRPLVEARVGPAALREEVIEDLVPPLVTEALRERSIEAIDRPHVEVRELERGRAARLVARVSIWPAVALPDLDALHVEPATTLVDEDMVDERLRNLRERLAEIQPVDRAVAAGDLVVGDLRLLVDGEEVPSEARPALEMEVREGVLVPELRAVLVGRSVGDVASAELVLPEDHENEKLRGRPATIEVTVQGVKEKRLPELTDEIASQLSEGAQQTPAALREAVRSDLEANATRLDELNYEQRVLREVVQGAEVDVPEALVEQELDQRREQMVKRLQERGLRWERFLSYRGQSEAEWRASEADDARDRVKVDIVLSEVEKKLDVVPTAEEVTEHIRSEVTRDPTLEGTPDDVDALAQNEIARHYFGHRLTRLQVLRELVARASGGALPAKAEAGAPAEAGAEASTTLEVEAGPLDSGEADR